jgi:neurexin
LFSSGTIAFTFHTIESNALLMYNSGPTSDSDFFAIEILDGYLYLILDLGTSFAHKMKASQIRVDDSVPHQVVFTFQGPNGHMNVDGQR